MRVEARPVAVLSLTQVVSWGTLYYSFPAVAASLARESSWSAPTVSGAFSLSLLVSAVCGPLVARLMERVGGAAAMAAGSALAASALLIVASATRIEVFYLGWTVAGAAASLTLYEAAFSVLARHHASTFRRSVGVVTLAGGFASTIFWPLSSALSSRLGWREALVSFAALHLFLCLPLHAFGLRAPAAPPVPQRAASGSFSAFRHPRLILLAVAFALSSFVTSVAAVHLIPRMVNSGESMAWALSLAALAGPFQVLARLTEFGSVVPRTVISGGIALSLLAISMGLLAGAWSGVALVLAVAAYGMANGMLTIVRSASIMDAAGPAAYARASGFALSPALGARAAGPFLAATLLSAGVTYGGLFRLMSLAAASALFLYLAASNFRSDRAPSPSPDGLA